MKPNNTDVNVQTLLNEHPFSPFQWVIFALCFFIVLLDGFDTAAIGYIAPDIRTQWQLTPGALAPLFGAGLLGLTGGALLCGPLGERPPFIDAHQHRDGKVREQVRDAQGPV